MQRLAFRRKNTHLEFWDKFTNRFWERILMLLETTKSKIVIPMVSKHIDFLFDDRNRIVRRALIERKDTNRLTLLMGSAPVG